MELLSILLSLLLLAALIYLLWRRQTDTLLKKVFFPALILKLFCGLALTYFYKIYFNGGDLQGFQHTGELLYQYFKDSPLSYFRLWLTDRYESETVRNSIPVLWYSNTYFMAMLLSFINIVTSGSLFLNTTFFSFFSFFGLWQLTKTLSKFNPVYKIPAIISFLFIPSVVFWSSGISKEAIYLGSLGWFVSVFLKIFINSKINLFKAGCSLLIAFYLLWKIKYFFALAIVALILFYFILYFLRSFSVKSHFQKKHLLFLFLLVVVTFCLAIPLLPALNQEHFFSELVRNYKSLSAKSVGKPILHYPNLQPTISSILTHSPLAFFNATFRPFIWESKALFYVIAGLENLLWLVLAVTSFINLAIHRPKKNDSFLLVLLLYCLVIGVIIGLTTPNLGTLSRYKTAFLPFFIFICLQASIFRKLWGYLNSDKGKL